MRAEAFNEADLACDTILGGKVRLWQPQAGYRAGTDPVVLASAVAAQPGQSVLELGCGAAPALCCLGRRVPDVHLSGLELQPGYAALARRNLKANALEGQIWDGDIAAPPHGLKAMSFDHVLANPPYFEPGARKSADDAGRELALAGATPLSEWVQLAAKRLRPRGYAVFIQRAERLPELMSAFEAHLGSLELLPLLPRAGRRPRLILLRGRKEGRASFVLHTPKVIHASQVHREPGVDYTPDFAAVMRGEALKFAD